MSHQFQIKPPNSSTIIDNIFIDYSRIGKFELFPIYNGTSDHDAQLILIHDITMLSYPRGSWKTRKIDELSLLNFNYNLSFELWKDVFDEGDVNVMFNTFLNTFL